MSIIDDGTFILLNVSFIVWVVNICGNEIVNVWALWVDVITWVDEFTCINDYKTVGIDVDTYV